MANEVVNKVANNKKLMWIGIASIVIIGGGIWWWKSRQSDETSKDETSKDETSKDTSGSEPVKDVKNLMKAIKIAKETKTAKTVVATPPTPVKPKPTVVSLKGKSVSDTLLSQDPKKFVGQRVFASADKTNVYAPDQWKLSGDKVISTVKKGQLLGVLSGVQLDKGGNLWIIVRSNLNSKLLYSVNATKLVF